MSEEKIMILKMLKDGKISEDEALKLLDAIGEKKGEKAYKPNKKRNEIHIEADDYDVFDASDKFASKISNFVNKIVSKSLQTAEEGMRNGRVYANFSFDDSKSFKNKKFATLKLDLDKNKKYNLIINNTNEKIEILPSSSDQIEVYGKIYYTNKKDIPENYEFINCFIDDKEILIEPNYSELTKKDFAVSLKVLVPAQDFATVKASTSNDKIKLDSIICDELYLTTSNDYIKIEDSIIGKSELKTTNDSVKIKDSKFSDLLINTTNAEITLNNTPFVNLEAHTTNAYVDVKDIFNSAENIIVTNSNGPVTLELENVSKNVKLNLRGLNKYTCPVIFDDDRFKLDKDNDELTTASLNNDSELTLFGDIKTSNGPIIIE
ncbi:MAG: SHOCT-like domain-containing protein [Fenollaria massiliensis]